MSDNEKNTNKRAMTRTTRVVSADAPKKKQLSRAASSVQPPPVFRVSGHITHRNTKSGLPGLRVEAIVEV